MMEHNTGQHYRPPPDRGHPRPQDQTRHAARMIYPSGMSPAHSSPQPSFNPSPRPTPLFYAWSNNRPTQIRYPPTALPGASVATSPVRHQDPRIHARSPMVNASDYPHSHPSHVKEQRPAPIPHPASGPINHGQSTTVGLGVPVISTTFTERCADYPLHTWGQKPFSDAGFATLDQDLVNIAPTAMTSDEEASIIDLRRYNDLENDYVQVDSYAEEVSRHYSRSPFSLSSSAPPEGPSPEDCPTSGAPSYISDCDIPVWSSLEPTQHLSPMPSPRHSFHGPIRDAPRSRGSPASYAGYRSSPYSMETGQNKRWSTGTYASTSSPVVAAANFNRYSYYGGSQLNPRSSATSFPNSANMSAAMLSCSSQPMFSPQPNAIPPPQHTLFSSPDTPFPHNNTQQYLPSQGFLRSLQSTSDGSALGYGASQFATFSEPPDLYSSLKEAPSDPPESDMNPSDPDLIPHQQELRFSGDLYTPRWVRGHGNKREGWCGLCKPGRWLVLKNSAFWYDKSFTHGISAATGAAFCNPEKTRRTEPNMDLWEGLCGSCGDWVNLVSNKKKGTTWFRHAYKCHSHSKVKDRPKRRRETSVETHQAQPHPTVRVRAPSNASHARSTASTSSSANTVIYSSYAALRQSDVALAAAAGSPAHGLSRIGGMHSPSRRRGISVVAGVKREREDSPTYQAESDSRASARPFARGYAVVDLPEEKATTTVSAFGSLSRMI